MHKYEHTDTDGDTLRIMTGYTKGETVVQIDQKRRLMGVNVSNSDIPAVAAELLKAAGQESVIVARSAAEIMDAGLGAITCGSGNEMAFAYLQHKPATLRARAANFVAIAEYIENKAVHEAEAEKKLQERRDALSFQLNGGGAELLRVPYAKRTATMRQAIDRIINLEDGK